MARLQELSHRIRARLLAASSLFVVGTLLAGPMPALADGDPTWTNNGYTDITTSTLQIDLAFTDKNGVQQDISLGSLSPALLKKAPQAFQQALADPGTQALLSNSLGSYFDSQWSQPDKKTHVSPHDAACENLKSQLISQVQQSLNTTPADIGCSLALGGGSVAALVADGTLTMQVPDHWQEVPCCNELPFYLVPGGQHVLISYWLPGDSVSFSLPDKTFGPSYRLDFDAELEIVVDISDNPCSDTVYSWSQVSDAKLNGTNAGATVDDFLAETFANWNPQVTEGQVDSGTYAAGATGSLSKLFNQLTTACTSDAFGFSDLRAGIQNGALAFTFSHPDIAKPQLVDFAAICNSVNFMSDIIGLEQVQVHPGDSDAVTGHFNIPTGTALRIGWGSSSSCGGGVDLPKGMNPPASLRWGQDGQPATTMLVSGDEFDPTNLSPGTTYDFQVQVCDVITCSPWSDPLSVTTGAAHSDSVQLRLVPQGIGQCKPRKIGGNNQETCVDLGTATMDANGALNTTVTIPQSTSPGEYAFEAFLNGGATTAVASMPLTVVKPGDQAQAILSGWDSIANRPIESTRAIQGGSVTLHGESFGPGSVSIRLDSANGKALATELVGFDGTFLATFTLPYVPIGSHTLVATEAGGASHATLAINVEGGLQ